MRSKKDFKDFKDYLAVKKGQSFNTIKCYTTRLRIIFDWLDGQELTSETIEKFLLHLREKGLSNSAINSYIGTLRNFNFYCQDREIETKNFTKNLKSFPKTRRKIEILSPEEIKRIYKTNLSYGKVWGHDASCLNRTYKALIMFLTFTGCRIGEAINLKLKELDLNNRQVSFIETKTKEDRTIPLASSLIEPLEKEIKSKKPTDYVFFNAVGSKIHFQDFSKDLKKRVKKAGITKRVYPHLFRHSFCTHLIEKGTSDMVVADLVGHKDIGTTQRYTHLLKETLLNGLNNHPLLGNHLTDRELIQRNYSLLLDLKKRLDRYEIKKGI